MKIYFNILIGSITQAFQQLASNKMRSFLSLLGILIGILCIILILSAVDSLQANIEQSFEKLGRDVLYVDRFPWNEDPGENFWKYSKRPNPDYNDYKTITTKVHSAEMASLAVFMPTNVIKFRNNSIHGAYMAGVTFEFGEIFKLEFESGRYFTNFEFETGSDRAILGYEIATSLFPNTDPVGKYINVRGRKLMVIGVLKKEGNSLVNVIPFDRAVIISYNQARKMINISSRTTWGTMLNVKANPGVSLDDLRDELTGVLRVHRHLKPIEDDDFSINELSTLTNLLAPIFKIMSLVGWVIGFFAILVGIFSVANIMFVSVKERTNQIGVKKALGAPRPVILIEFLIESIILCLVGGALGLIIVFGITELATKLSGFHFYLPAKNIILGVSMSVIIGVLSGIIPAWQAARLDPVEAIRS
ncbi:MAG TPA: ABC transporter permease [Saprospiraceae bacterium]|nr:ABC transporter permease [Saprospiraceae bacterium]